MPLSSPKAISCLIWSKVFHVKWLFLVQNSFVTREEAENRNKDIIRHAVLTRIAACVYKREGKV